MRRRAGTLWAIATWPTIVADTYHASQAVLGMLIGGDGLVGLCTLAGDAAARVLAQGGAVDYWHPFDSTAQAITAGIAAFFVLLGMAVAGILVLLAEIELLVGAAVAPLILPGLAFGLTRQFGWGAVFFLVRGALRVIATGAVAAVMARAVATVVSVPGTDAVMTWSQMAELVTLSVATAVVCWAGRGIAGHMVGQPGVLGMGSVTRVTSFATTATGGVGAAAVGVGSAAGRGVATAAAAKGGRGAAAAGVVHRSNGRGSVFAATP